MRHLNVIELNQVSGGGADAAAAAAADAAASATEAAVDAATKTLETVPPAASSNWLRNVGFGVVLAAVAGAGYYAYNRYYAK